jgi:leucyl aminopeptidase (aminopeptidase T)
MDPGRGLPGLLNIGAERHWTIFVSDFALRRSDVDRVRRQVAGVPTRLLFTRVGSVQRQLRTAGVDPQNDYLSLQVIVSRFENIRRLHELFTSLPRADMARLDLPFAGTRFQRSFATHALDVVMNADYGEQDRISDRFFRHLERTVPYRVVLRTGESGELVISDDVAWFHLAGRLDAGESRSLPGGEVAYTGNRMAGDFTVDGAILPSPQRPAAGRTAARLAPLSNYLAQNPLRVVIRDGRVIQFEGNPKIADPLRALLDRDDRYGQVTEVGISFNRACGRFIHDWPAASNEGRPGVHIAIGGDPDRSHPRARRRAALVHIDLMAATSAVWVNDTPFLHTS